MAGAVPVGKEILSGGGVFSQGPRAQHGSGGEERSDEAPEPAAGHG